MSDQRLEFPLSAHPRGCWPIMSKRSILLSSVLLYIIIDVGLGCEKILLSTCRDIDIKHAAVGKRGKADPHRNTRTGEGK